jgi:hypothetical protein
LYGCATRRAVQGESPAVDAARLVEEMSNIQQAISNVEVEEEAGSALFTSIFVIACSIFVISFGRAALRAAE